MTEPKVVINIQEKIPVFLQQLESQAINTPSKDKYRIEDKNFKE